MEIRHDLRDIAPSIMYCCETLFSLPCLHGETRNPWGSRENTRILPCCVRPFHRVREAIASGHNALMILQTYSANIRDIRKYNVVYDSWRHNT